MDKEKPTLGVYGIPDRNNLPFPEESHDHGIVLMDKGRIVKSLQLERKTRIKHDHRLSDHIYNLLKTTGLLPGDYDIAFSNNVLGSSMISTNGKLRLEGPFQDQISDHPQKSHAWWLDRGRDAWLVNHELAHIYSTLPFYGDFPENSLLVHFDGGASKSNFSAWINKNRKIELIEASWDLKYLSAFFNANALCFGIIGAKKEEQLSVPGKLMGLASYGAYSKEIEEWLRNNNWFSNIWGSKREFIESASRYFGWKARGLDSRDEFLQNIVASFHEVFVRETIKKIKSLAEKNDCNNLIFTGGSALNIVLNARLIRSGLFEKVLIPPCTNDSGLALGAASCLEYYKHGEIEVHSPYIDDWDDDYAESHEVKYSEKDIELTGKWIVDGEIIGICNGKGEAGPRALGNRSLVCRADDNELSGKLSRVVKGREWYRPLAPIMRTGSIEKYTGEKNPSLAGKFMLDEFRILPEFKKQIKGGVHIDGTARIQYLEGRRDNPFIWDLLSFLELNYNIDCLINTSFNIRGEPIVGSMSDAKQTAKKMNLKAMVLNGHACLV